MATSTSARIASPSCTYPMCTSSMLCRRNSATRSCLDVDVVLGKVLKCCFIPRSHCSINHDSKMIKEEGGISHTLKYSLMSTKVGNFMFELKARSLQVLSSPLGWLIMSNRKSL